MSIKQLLKCFENKDMRLMVLRDFAWFPRFRYKHHPDMPPTHWI
jgi:hypothetical protein